jgi:hypothetical protein
VTPRFARGVLLAFLAVVVAFLASGCGPALPSGAYQPPTLPGAVELASKWWGIETDPADVFLVKADCVPYLHTTMTGFSFKGRCAYGVELDGLVFVSDRGQDRYSGTSLVHELAHLKHHDDNHTAAEIWGTPGTWPWPSGGAVAAGNAFLSRNPTVDAIGEVTR